MNTIFTYDNWPYFFVAIIIFLILINTSRCHNAGKYLTLYASESSKNMNMNTQQVAGQVAQQVAGQVAQQVSEQVAGQVAGQVAQQVSEQVAGQVSSIIATETTSNILTENFASKRKPIVIYNGSKKNKEKMTIPQTFTKYVKEPFKSIKKIAQREKFSKNNKKQRIFKKNKSTKEQFNTVKNNPKSVKIVRANKPVKVIKREDFTKNKKPVRIVKNVSQRETFAPYNMDRSVEGVDIGAYGSKMGCNKNLNDQINYGVNSYIFPNCNNDYSCTNGCGIQNQINGYQFDYRMGQSSTELERSKSGMYTSLNVDSCSQNCPSMNWLPPNEYNRNEANSYIQSLEPMTLKKN